MQPANGCLWVGDPKIPAPLGRYLGFDLRSETPRAEQTITASGYSHTLECYEHFKAGRQQDAIMAGEQALQVDGPSVPLCLMLAKVTLTVGDEEATCRYEEQARKLLAASGKRNQPSRIPFPSAINPQVYLEYPSRG
jgi:hypothetical protein